MLTYLKKYWYLVLICLIFLIGLKLINYILPKANPIELPSTEKISMIQINKYNYKLEYTDQESIQNIVKVFLTSKKTRKMSVNDAPVVNEFYTVRFILEDDYRDYYIYKQDFNWYIEQPYYGIYKVKKDKLTFIDLIK